MAADPGDLYGLPLDRFVAERGGLAKALRAEGRREEAAEVAALRKPSAAAWAVNQVVRTQRRTFEELLEAGDALRAAQDGLLAGRGDARALRAAADRERAAVDELVEAARGLLTSEGHELGAAIIERVSETLHAAALDDAAREQVRDGRLVRELRHVGFGLGDAAVAVPPAPEARGKARAAPRGKGRAAPGGGHKPAKTGKARGAADRAAREQADRAARAAERAAREKAQKAARAAELAARRRVERAARALAEAQERRDRAAQRLADADAALASVREEAEAAASEHGRAQAQLEDA